MEAKRHTCIVCKVKKADYKMIRHGRSWTCKHCLSVPELSYDSGIISAGVGTSCVDRGGLKVLNLYAGLGGNRALWPRTVSVTAVEKNVKVAAAYKSLYPNDTVICADAHAYLLKNYNKFDLVWVSPPCQSHSRMNYTFGDRRRMYVDMNLYQEILLLKHFHRRTWVVENVTPYYNPLIPVDYKVGRHSFWSNFKINDCHVPQLSGFINYRSADDKQRIMDWLGIHYEPNLYLSGKCYVQVFRNCVHPVLGLSVFRDAIASMAVSSVEK